MNPSTEKFSRGNGPQEDSRGTRLHRYLGTESGFLLVTLVAVVTGGVGSTVLDFMGDRKMIADVTRDSVEFCLYCAVLLPVFWVSRMALQSVALRRMVLVCILCLLAKQVLDVTEESGYFESVPVLGRSYPLPASVFEQILMLFSFCALLAGLCFSAIETQKSRDQAQEESRRLRGEVKRRQETEERLLKSQALLNETQRVTKVGGWEYDVQKGKGYWTDEVYRIHDLAVGAEEDLFEVSLSCYRPEDRAVIEDAYRGAVEEGTPYDLELRFMSTKGKQMWVRMTATPVLEGGKVVRVVGNIMDISERKQAENALEESERLYRKAIEVAGAVPYYQDYATLAYEFVGSGIEGLTGYKPEEFTYGTWESMELEVIRLGMSAGLTEEEAIAKARGSEGISWRADYRVRTRSGEEKWLANAAIQVRDEQGNIVGSLGTLQDITERKRAEEALRVSESKYRSLLQQLPQGVVIVQGLPPRYVFVNAAMAQIVGCSVEDLLGFSTENAGVVIHPDDRKTAERRYRDRLRGRTGPSYDEFRLLRRDGEVRWVGSFAKRIDYEGEPTIQAIVQDITDRRLAEEALIREKDFSETVINSLPGVFYLFDEDGTMIRWNTNFEEVSGYTGEEIARMKPTDSFLGADREKISEGIRMGFLQGSTDAEADFVTKDGKRVPYYFTGLRVAMGGKIFLSGVGIDITDRKRAEEALRFTQFAVDHAGDAAYWVDPDGRFVYVNETACRSLGYSREELLSMNVHDIAPGLYKETWSAQWESLRQRHSITLESRHRRKDGSVFPVEITANFMEYEGRIYDCAFARDITARKRAEEERRQLEIQVQQTQKLESLGVLAGGIAHDFNNLLMGVLGNADLALMDLSPVHPARECVEEIGKAARRAADLSRQMLAYSGKGKFVVVPLDLTELVGEMGHLLESSISKSARLSFHLEEGLPAIEADATQIRQVVMNLIINASEAIGKQPGVVQLTTGLIDCTRDFLSQTYLDEKQPEGRYVYLEVSDTGCGMDEETLGKIFDPFFTTKFTGRGLGLAALLGIVRGHRGAIRVKSESGRGTTFTILFPAAAEAPLPQPAEGAEPVVWRGSGVILLVDDEGSVLSTGKRMLERAGFGVLTAGDGYEALELFKRQGDRISCVILDMTMPEMDGEETFCELRKINAEIPVILSSGYSQEEIESRFAGKGLAGFIQKPYRWTDLVSHLRGAMGD